jgi:uncharacterized membrane protein (DUF2068 family)
LPALSPTARRDRSHKLQYVDWNLLMCGIRRHVSYAPEEPGLRARLRATSAAGEAWRCLRCGTFVLGGPSASGPAAKAPGVRRGRELRSAFILRLFAAERFLRAIAFAVIAYGVWRFKYSRNSIEQAFNRELPVVRSTLRGLGFDIDNSKLIGLIRHAFTLDPRTLTWLAVAAAGYALIEVLEGAGLWLLMRWGEYFAMVATSVGIPYEIYELTAKVTVLRLGAFIINLALVAYLVLTKRLFGSRGGKKAYDARLRSESIIDSAMAAEEPPGTAAEQDAAGAAGSPAAATDITPAARITPTAGAPAVPDVTVNRMSQTRGRPRNKDSA